MAVALSVNQAAPACTEHELVAAVRRGSDRAFEELYSRYRSQIGSFVFGMVGDHQRAEDIAQEVFIAALRRLRATERRIVFKPWIYEIAKNACIDEFRRTRRVREVPLESEQGEPAPPRLIAQGVDHVIADKQRLDHLRGAFRGLSESHHRIIVMREFEGRSYAQIGETMGMTKPVVESTLLRARRRLSEEYEELVSGRRCERVQTMIAADGVRPLRSLGIRERRLLARHLAQCQPCRRSARLAGLDESFFHRPRLAAKLAALLPIPWLGGRRSHTGRNASGAADAHRIGALQSLQRVGPLADAAGPAAGLGRAAATAAAIVVAGAGGGLVTGLTHHPQRKAEPRLERPSRVGSAGVKGSLNRQSAAGRSAGSQTRGAGAAGASARSGRNRSIDGRSHAHADAAPRVGSSSPASGSRGSAAGGRSGSTSSPSSPVSHPVASGAPAANALPVGHTGLGSGGSNTAARSVPVPKLPSVHRATVSAPRPPNPVSSLPKVPLPTVSVPKLPPPSVPDPSSVLPRLGG